MKSKIYHGDLKLDQTAAALGAFFNRGALTSEVTVDGDQAVVQIHSAPGYQSGGATHLGVSLRQGGDRLEVTVGDQGIFGLAGSLGASALLGLLNPWNLLGRIDDIAQDIEHLTLEDQVWAVLDKLAKEAGASQRLSERLQRLTCAYCGVANKVGDGNCQACGAPLGEIQPKTCPRCGYLVFRDEPKCPKCGYKMQ
jgi:hypothetical protein